MKQVIFFLALMTTAGAVSAQHTDSDSSANLHNYYLEKSKKQKKGAWILLSSGILISSVSFVAASVTVWDDFADNLAGDTSPDKSSQFIAVSMVGGAAMLGSIPLFITASKNKKRE